MTKKKERLCRECQRPIPDERRGFLCSDACRDKRERRKRDESRERQKLGTAKKATPRRKRNERAEEGTRPCAGGCGRMINDYRCPECWAKLRAAHGLSLNPEESVVELYSCSWRRR